MNQLFVPTIRGFGLVANSQAPTESIARRAATIAAPPKRPTFDQTHPFFMPAWVRGETESRLGYVVCLSYPAATVNVPGIGLIDAPIKRLKFITDPRGRNIAYALLGLNDTPCAAMIVVPSQAKINKTMESAK
jgi:hypothetical protein